MAANAPNQPMLASAFHENTTGNKKEPIKLIEVSLEPQQAHRIMPPHWHRSLEIIIPKINGCKIFVRGRQYEVMPDDFFIVNPREIHTCRGIYPTEEYHGYVLHVNYDFLMELAPSTSNSQIEHVIQGEDKGRLLQLLDLIIKEHKEQNPYADLAIQGYFLLFLSELLKKYSSRNYFSDENHTNRQFERIVEVLNFLNENYASSIEVKDLAAQFHFSYGHLARLFQQHLNMSVTQYLTEVRTRNACYDLIHTNLTVTEIALQNGFPNGKAFHTAFKRNYQLTPAQYRKKNARN